MIKVSRFGMFNNQPVLQARLESSSGVLVDILSFGATIRDWRVPIGDQLRPVVLGYDTFAPYPKHGQFFGAVIGRVANRIGEGQFNLLGKQYSMPTNDGPHMLHGGVKGLHVQNWRMETDETRNCVRLSYTSEHDEMGFPGRVDFRVEYRLSGNRLYLDMHGVPDRPTPISLTQHNYFNLGTDAHILDHHYFIDADRFTPVDKQLIPTGKILSVLGSGYDFSKPKNMRSNKDKAHEFDVGLVLRRTRDINTPAAIVQSATRDLTLKLYTDRPGLQLYNGVHLGPHMPTNTDKKFDQFSGFCLEDQMLTNALSHANFPSIICDPERPYKHKCEIEIG